MKKVFAALAAVAALLVGAPTAQAALTAPTSLTISSTGEPIVLSWSPGGAPETVQYRVFRAPWNSATASWGSLATAVADVSTTAYFETPPQQAYRYYVKSEDVNGNLSSDRSPYAYTEPTPFDPEALFNQKPPDTSTDTNSSAAVSEFAGHVTNPPPNTPPQVSLSTRTNVPTENIAKSTSTSFAVSGAPGVSTFVGPQPPVLETCPLPNPPGSCSTSNDDFPTEVLNPYDSTAPSLLRCWQATWTTSPNTLHCNGGGKFYYNDDSLDYNNTEDCRDYTGNAGTMPPFDGTSDLCPSLGQPTNGGSGASNGLAYYAGLVTPEEVDQRAIRHALRVSIPNTDLLCTYRPPARKYETSGCNSNSSGNVPDGAIFKLKNHATEGGPDCDNLNMPSGWPGGSTGLAWKALKTICHALQDYGVMVGDGGGSGPTFYFENDLTASWVNHLGTANGCTSNSGYASWTWLLRPQGSSWSCGGGKAGTYGLPWGAANWKLTAAPTNFITW